MNTRYCIIAYAVAALITAGWISTDPCVDKYSDGTCRDSFSAWIAGVYGGVFWPIYWSHEAFLPLRKP